jgi:uncharacterized linocin/CFP29 family protein
MGDFGPAMTDDQWNRIRQIVHDEALRARVAASFLPLYGPLPGDTTTVPKDELSQPQPGATGTLGVDDDKTIRLASVSANVTLKNHMLADPELGAASILFRRAANIIARVEDALIFRGKKKSDKPPIPSTDQLPQVFDISGSDDYDGLVGLVPDVNKVQIDKAKPASLGANVYAGVVKAITKLEAAGYFKPFACVLSNELFSEVYTPIPGSMVLPADSLPPVLSGPLLRSSTLKDGTGLVISLQGNPVEIVVGSDINVRYLQANANGEHLFRVSQRLVLRVKDKTSLALIAAPAAGGAAT